MSWFSWILYQNHEKGGIPMMETDMKTDVFQFHWLKGRFSSSKCNENYSYQNRGVELMKMPLLINEIEIYKIMSAP